MYVTYVTFDQSGSIKCKIMVDTKMESTLLCFSLFFVVMFPSFAYTYVGNSILYVLPFF